MSVSVAGHSTPAHDLAADGDTCSEVQEPSTPGREEAASATQQQQRPVRLGKRTCNADSDPGPSLQSYDSMYEEANALLKNLHFQRLKRIAGDRDS